MSTEQLAAAPRHTAVLAAVAGLHVGAFILVVSALHPHLDWPKTPPPFLYALQVPPKAVPVAPQAAEPVDDGTAREPEPIVLIPAFDGVGSPQSENVPAADPRARSGPVVPTPDLRAPTLDIPDDRLAALVNACYPMSARRLGEEGRAVVQLRIDADGRVRAWNFERRSASGRLDAAVECVVRRLEFVPGKRDGEAVEATALLPIVFRLGR